MRYVASNRKARYRLSIYIITQKRLWEAQAKWPHAATGLEAWYRLIKTRELFMAS